MSKLSKCPATNPLMLKTLQKSYNVYYKGNLIFQNLCHKTEKSFSRQFFNGTNVLTGKHFTGTVVWRQR